MLPHGDGCNQKLLVNANIRPLLKIRTERIYEAETVRNCNDSVLLCYCKHPPWQHRQKESCEYE